MSMAQLLGPLALGAVLSLATAIGGAIKSMMFVQEGELGLKKRFGKVVRHRTGPHCTIKPFFRLYGWVIRRPYVSPPEGPPKIIKPGLALYLPIAESLIRQHIKQDTINFADQTVTLQQSKMAFVVTAVVRFRVVDIYQARVEILDYKRSVQDACSMALRAELSTLSVDEILRFDDVSERLLQRVASQAEEWGVEFLQFGLTDCNATPETAPMMVTEPHAEIRHQPYKRIISADVPPMIAAVLVTGAPMLLGTAATDAAVEQVQLATIPVHSNGHASPS